MDAAMKDMLRSLFLPWHGGPQPDLERQIRERLRELAEMPHMRPELRSMFRTWARENVTTAEVLAAVSATVEALRDVERFVAGAERLT